MKDLWHFPENATGRKPKSCYVECGIFCTLGGEQ